MKINLILSLLISTVVGHSKMYKPAVRGNCITGDVCPEQEGCLGPCETPKDSVDYRYRKKEKFTRGQEIEVGWLRLNHPGGFVRLALVPTSQSDNHKAFDDNVYLYTCFESNCSQDKDMDNGFWGYMAGPNTDGPKGRCSTKFTIPSHLDDGEYTLQFIWHSGGVNTGDRFAAFGNYYSCSDIIISGGLKGNKPEPQFKGGDIVTSNPEQCRFWGKNDHRSCATTFIEEDPERCPRGSPRLGAPAMFSKSKYGEEASRGIPYIPPKEWSDRFPEPMMLTTPGYFVSSKSPYHPAKDAVEQAKRTGFTCSPFHVPPPPQFSEEPEVLYPVQPPAQSQSTNTPQPTYETKPVEYPTTSTYQVQPPAYETGPAPSNNAGGWTPPPGWKWTPPPGWKWTPPPGYDWRKDIKS